ncbi:MAG: hypothetical protein H6661_04455 [Ardenticatenaceae bacterium]|nr:hypothetical protein [Ardenticatenaceae bacterium]
MDRDWYGFGFTVKVKIPIRRPTKSDFKVVRGGSWLATADEWKRQRAVRLIRW